MAIFNNPSAQAQITIVGNDTAQPIQGVGHDYVKLLSETVNPANGSVELSIQVPVPKARGLAVPFSFRYSSSGIHHIMPGVGLGTATWARSTGYLSQGGWSYGLPMVNDNQWSNNGDLTTGQVQTCYYSSFYIFRDAAGAQHSLGVNAMYGVSTGIPQCTAEGSEAPTGGDAQVQAQLTGCLFCGQATPPLIISDTEGTVYSVPNISHLVNDGNGPTYYSVPAYVEDRNGNKGTTSTDTLGRTVYSSSGFGPSGATNTLTFSGLTYQVTWTTTSSSYPTPNQNIGTPGAGCSALPSVADSQVVVSKITLPNGQFFRFYYGTDNPDPTLANPHGLLSEIDYPSGGW
jgi:hypothetical protein